MSAPPGRDPSPGKAARPEVLFLAHRIPYPPDKGDKIRSWRLFQHLRARFDVHLGCFVDDPEDLQHRDFLRSQCASALFRRLDPRIARLKSARGFLTGAPLTMPYYRDAAMARWVSAARDRGVAAEIAFSSSMAQYIARPREGGIRIIDLCDADSAKWKQYAERRKGLMAMIYAREGRRLAKAEREMIAWSDAAFAVSPEEARVLAAGQGHPHWYGNGTDTDFFDPDGEDPGGDAPKAEIVFVGAMDYWANADAAVWFVNECWPAVRASQPHATLAIVGARPVRQVRALAAEPGVAVTGRVRDVRPFLKAARLAVAPMRVARGVQNKVLEAMAMARPVVATPAAAEGIDAAPGEELVIADGADSFARSVCDLLDDAGRRRAIGAAARARILRDYSWRRQLARFDAVLDPLLARRAAR